MEGDRARVGRRRRRHHRGAASPTTSPRPGGPTSSCVEKGELTSGSTCHAAGLVTQFNPSPTMMRFRRYSVELYRGARRVRAARQPADRLQPGEPDGAAAAAPAGRAGSASTSRCVGPKRGARADAAGHARSPCYGAVWVGRDGCVDPHTATYALADAARGLGVEHPHAHAGDRHRARPRPRGVRRRDRPPARIETEVVVNACGIWAPQVAAMVGAFTPSVPVDHQHIALEAVDGHELPRDMPCFRDTDNLVYGRSEAGGALFGGYEPDPVARWVDGVPWDHGDRALPPDHERFDQLMAGRGAPLPVPRGRRRRGARLPPRRDDARRQPPARPAAGRARVLDGGRPLAERLRRRRRDRQDDRRVDHDRRDRARHSPATAPGASAPPTAAPAQVEAAGREVYRYYYRLRYPLDTDEWGRPNRLAPLHGRLQDAGAVFGVEERLGARRLLRARAAVAARRGRPARVRLDAPALVRPAAEEHTAFRERAGMIDMTSFGKIEVQGPGALALLERVADNLDRPRRRERRLHPVPEPPRRDRRRRDGHAARRGPLPGGDRRGLRRLRPRAGSGRTSSPRTARSRCATRAPSWR